MRDDEHTRAVTMDKQCYLFEMRHCLALASIAVLCAAACGNDFDALFTGGDVGKADGGNVTPGKPGACGTPAASCAPKSGCDQGQCTYACSGCDCKCPAYECPRGEGTDACDVDCGPGTACNVVCNVRECRFRATGAVASFRCEDETCGVSCTDGASCDVRCENDRSCDVKCSGKGTTCTLSCAATPTSCVLTCADGEFRKCPGNIQTCNLECPN